MNETVGRRLPYAGYDYSCRDDGESGPIGCLAGPVGEEGVNGEEPNMGKLEMERGKRQKHRGMIMRDGRGMR